MKNKTKYRILTLLIPIVILFLYLIRNYLINFAVHLPRCFFYSVFHRYCPSCGNTRSVTAFLHGDLLASLRYNVVPMIGFIIITLGYIELAAFSFGKPIRLLPRKPAPYLILIGILVLYWIIRNFIPYLTP